MRKLGHSDVSIALVQSTIHSTWLGSGIKHYARRTY